MSASTPLNEPIQDPDQTTVPSEDAGPESSGPDTLELTAEEASYAAELTKKTELITEYMARTFSDPTLDLAPEDNELPRSTKPLRRKVFERFSRSDLTDDLTLSLVSLFNNHFATWDESAEEKLGESAVKGKNVLISPAELRGRYLPADVDASLVTVHADGELAGFATSCNWTDPDDRAITWITLLVVHKDYRRRGLATGLINEVRDGGYRAGVYGIISAHPAACIALARVCGNTIRAIDHHFITNHTDGILDTCPLEHIRMAAPYGSLFPEEQSNECNGHDHSCLPVQDDGYDGVMTTVFTNFYIDLSDTWSTLATLQAKRIRWPLGEVPCGYEYLVCFETKQR